MGSRKKMFIAIGVLSALSIIGYYSYRRDQEVRNNGVYTLAEICPIRAAKNGWKVRTSLSYKGVSYQFDPVVDWENFKFNDNCQTFVVKILDYNPNAGFFLIPRRIFAPDSIQPAPPSGWTEQWMEEHFPRVVEYVHDTR